MIFEENELECIKEIAENIFKLLDKHNKSFDILSGKVWWNSGLNATQSIVRLLSNCKFNLTRHEDEFMLIMQFPRAETMEGWFLELLDLLPDEGGVFYSDEKKQKLYLYVFEVAVDIFFAFKEKFGELEWIQVVV